MDLSLRMIARRARSEGEIGSTLAGLGYSKTLVRGVLGRLRSLGYIDDRKFAAECAERWTERGFGSLRIEEQLKRHEVDEKIIATVMPEAREERARAREVMRKHFGETVADRRTAARAARFLAGRGFPAEIVDSLFDLWE
jgi:regulatory protein